MSIRTSKKYIILKNMKAQRVGQGIRVAREGQRMNQEQLASAVHIDVPYLVRLEEGCEPKINRDVLEGILRATGYRQRGSGLSDEDLINIFLYYAIKGDTPKQSLL
jgi:hypothetical protein